MPNSFHTPNVSEEKNQVAKMRKAVKKNENVMETIDLNPITKSPYKNVLMAEYVNNPETMTNTESTVKDNTNPTDTNFPNRIRNCGLKRNFIADPLSLH